ncbi:uncharacterized protein [Polyergus mexicanus]|uniref:uncharacterized protein n=1 Tax=Polyergus mexicanus TaxID=615972 RepID=UPI0038B4FE13
MFRQIQVHPDDWDLQRILWVDDQLNIIPYQLTTVTYGTRSAPFLAVRVLLQLVKDEGRNYSLAVRSLLKGRYVDDICSGADTLPELISIAHQLVNLCKAGGFPLAKWQNNHPELFRALPRDGAAVEPHSFANTQGKILGLTWQPHSDQFVFQSKASNRPVITKRTILSEVVQLFDPLGFLSPVIIRAKTLLQELWLEKVGWDDCLSPQLRDWWTHFRSELSDLTSITIPRWMSLTPSATVELHGFSDASQLAMAAAVYIKVTPHMTESIITLVCAKTKVAPLKRLTIPRLELTAAVLLSRLISYVQRTLEFAEIPIYLWTDSSGSLTWINSHPSRWKDFVRNRVAAIQERVPQGHWRFIPGKENPADCASRDLSSAQLSRHHLWWNGPSWLAQSPQHWPSTVSQLDSAATLGERPGLLLTSSTIRQHHLWELLYRYSSLTRLLRITAHCQRCCATLKGIPQSSLATPLTPADLEVSRLYWIRSVQSAYFTSELTIISSGAHLSRSHPLAKFTAFIDHSGILRVGGRLRHSQLDSECKHPAILPRDSYLSRLIISDAHLRTLHGGTQVTLTYLRQAYWIVGGRAPVRSYILRCVRCARQRGVRAQQLMGQLPSSRIRPSRPFLNTGVDYAGPLTLKTWRGREAKCHKGWLAIFVCFSTSAVHLEAVTDYSTDGFIAAYRRLTERRGICQTLFSDCGTNFQGADTSLKRLFNAGSKEFSELTQLLTHDGTTWVFNPPAAPHFGCKWEAAVKSVKHHLRRTIGETALTYEELTTLLVQIEAVLNSRPLCPLSDDPEDLAALTPGHFIIGAAPTTIPEPSLSAVPLPRLSRWQLDQQQFQHFWSRWSAECLQRQLAISKWHPSLHANQGRLSCTSHG